MKTNFVFWNKARGIGRKQIAILCIKAEKHDYQDFYLPRAYSHLVYTGNAFLKEYILVTP